MCKVQNRAHGLLISVKSHGDTMCFSDFTGAYEFATLKLDPEDPVELIEVHGMPPGMQNEKFFPDDRDAIEVALNAIVPFPES